MKHWMIALFCSLAPLTAQGQPAPQGGERAPEEWRQRLEETQQQLRQAREQLQRLMQERTGGERRDGAAPRPMQQGERRQPQGDGPRDGGQRDVGQRDGGMRRRDAGPRDDRRTEARRNRDGERSDGRGDARREGARGQGRSQDRGDRRMTPPTRSPMPERLQPLQRLRAQWLRQGPSTGGGRGEGRMQGAPMRQRLQQMQQLRERAQQFRGGALRGESRHGRQPMPAPKRPLSRGRGGRAV